MIVMRIWKKDRLFNRTEVLSMYMSNVTETPLNRRCHTVYQKSYIHFWIFTCLKNCLDEISHKMLVDHVSGIRF